LPAYQTAAKIYAILYGSWLTRQAITFFISGSIYNNPSNLGHALVAQPVHGLTLSLPGRVELDIKQSRIIR
jgi:hypothetical protein